MGNPVTLPFNAVVIFTDGNRVDARVGLKQIIGMERRYKNESRTVVNTDGSMETVEASTLHTEKLVYGAWLALRQPMNDFDLWLDQVENMEIVEEEDVTPSQPAPGDDSSPTSPQTPDSTPSDGQPTSS